MIIFANFFYHNKDDLSQWKFYKLPKNITLQVSAANFTVKQRRALSVSLSVALSVSLSVVRNWHYFPKYFTKKLLSKQPGTY